MSVSRTYTVQTVFHSLIPRSKTSKTLLSFDWVPLIAPVKLSTRYDCRRGAILRDDCDRGIGLVFDRICHCYRSFAVSILSIFIYKQRRRGLKSIDRAGSSIFATESCKFRTEEIRGCSKFQFQFQFCPMHLSKLGGGFIPNVAFLDENFPTKIFGNFPTAQNLGGRAIAPLP